jgi:centrosomal protein CEP41
MQKNQPGKLIIVYAWDERPGVEAAQKFSQRDYSNIYLLSGGLEQFVKDCYDLLEGPRLPPRPIEPVSPHKTAKARSTVSQAGFTGMSRK